MDGQSIHGKLVQKVQGDVVGNEQPALIDIGNCGLHTVYGVFKALGGNSWDDYQSFSNSVIYPLKFCATL